MISCIRPKQYWNYQHSQKKKDFFVPHSPEVIQAVKGFWGEMKDIWSSGIVSCAVTHSPSNK